MRQIKESIKRTEFNRRQDEDMVRKDELTVKMPIGKWSGKDRLNVLDALRWNVKIKLMKIVSNNMPPVAQENWH